MNISGTAQSTPLQPYVAAGKAQPKLSLLQKKTAIDTTYDGLLVVPDDRATLLTLEPKPAPSHKQSFTFYFKERFASLSVPRAVDAAWNERAGTGLTNSLQSILEGTPLTSKNATLSAVVKDGKLDTLDFDMRLQQQEEGVRAGTMARYFDFGDADGPVVEHAYFSLSPEFQDAGLARTILSNSVKLYQKLGIDRVTLQAGLSVGGYAWAKYGFKPDSEESWDQLRDEVRWSLDQLELPRCTQRAVERLLRSDDPKSVWALSDLGIMVKDLNGEQTKLGKALLMGTGWYGELDLKDEESMNRFHQYVSNGSKER